MDVRELKKEVENLPNISHAAAQLLQQTSAQVAVLQPFSAYPHARRLFQDLKKNIEDIKQQHRINDLLSLNVHHLQELKLAALRGTSLKAPTLAHCLHYDDLLSLSATSQRIIQLENTLHTFKRIYTELEKHLTSTFSLDETVSFLTSSPHQTFSLLQNVITKQKNILVHLQNHSKEFLGGRRKK